MALGLYLITYFWNVWSLAILLSYFIVLYANKDPGTGIVTHLFLYGKCRELGFDKLVVPFLQVPKKWFYHFYVICVCCTAGVLLTTCYTIHMSSQWPLTMLYILTFFRYPSPAQDVTDVMPVILVLILEMFQGSRRLYECTHISSYSEGTMSILVYLTGVLFYTLFGLSIIVPLKGALISIGPLQWNHMFGIILFFWSSFKQYQIAKTFAKLRQNKSGAVTNTEHHVPCGDLFEYVSCPHYLMEILIYLSFVIICGLRHQTCLSVFLFVVTNQTIAGKMNHQWYHDKFPKYPKNRKSVYPFLF